jgi:hypothetical protein
VEEILTFKTFKAFNKQVACKTDNNYQEYIICNGMLWYNIVYSLYNVNVGKTV